MLELWELGGRDDCRFSTFSWRTRLALHHKGLPFAVHPVAVSDKAAVGFVAEEGVAELGEHGLEFGLLLRRPAGQLVA